ncbi:SGNH/GDSL hydrolase family protein [Nocardioides houyundeii]|uniref:SGNH/GDSL hydrolase family protein n=1 Tax=Nocardioides houyundeii TaxID=2045452 RepID=UPI000DF19953|nr:SGNH/GDSL hydrolase family protein [Nocardioides houyundeii]
MSRRMLLLLVVAGCLAVGAMTACALSYSPDDDSGTEVADTDAELRDFLRPWFSALADQEEKPAKIVVVGDSISEGAMLPTPIHQIRFVRRLQEMLRDQQDAVGGAGFFPAYYGDPFSVDDSTRSGVPAQEHSFDSWGLGGRALFLPDGSSVTYPPQQSTGIRVWFGLIDVLAGAGRVIVDGVDVTSQGTLSTGEVPGETITSAGTPARSGIWWQSPPMSRGAHTVAVSGAGPGGVFVHTGVEFLDGDEDSGIHVYDASHSGATAQDFDSEAMAAGHWADVRAIDPQLVLINLGTNVDPDYAASLERLVELALESAPHAQVVLVHGYEPGHWSARDWEEVRQVRESVAARHADRVGFFDLAAHWPALAKDGSTSEGLMLEEAPPIHPNTAGNERMAEIFAELLELP